MPSAGALFAQLRKYWQPVGRVADVASTSLYLAARFLEQRLVVSAARPTDSGRALTQPVGDAELVRTRHGHDLREVNAIRSSRVDPPD